MSYRRLKEFWHLAKIDLCLELEYDFTLYLESGDEVKPLFLVKTLEGREVCWYSLTLMK